MKSKSQLQGILTTIVVAWPTLAGCSGDDAARAGAKAPANEVLAAAAASTLVEQVGVEPGPVQQTAGAPAVLAKLEGTVEVRRLGEELFAPAKQDQTLYLGDQVRAGDGAQATILFADQSTVELAEVSTLAIGSRATTADPASSAAVLAGVARFTGATP